MKKLLMILVFVMGLTVSGLAEDYHYTTASYLLRAHQTHLLIKPVPIMFEVDTELEALWRVYQYLNERFKYVDDDENAYWTSSDTMLERMYGDCEDWAMLFVAILRFSTTRPISADRIWVICSFDPMFGGHAWVLYRTKYGQVYSFDVVKDIYAHKGWQVPANYMFVMFNDKYADDFFWRWSSQKELEE